MCVVAAPIAMYAMLALSAAATAMQIKSSLDQASAQKKAYQNQAAAQEAAFELRKEDRKRRADALLGTQRALFNASGVELEGTPTDVAGSTSEGFAREEFNDRFNLSTQVAALNDSANLAMSSARSQAIGSVMNFGSRALATSSLFSSPTVPTYGGTYTASGAGGTAWMNPALGGWGAMGGGV